MLEALADYTASKNGRRPGFSSKLVHHYMGQDTKLGRYVAILHQLYFLALILRAVYIGILCRLKCSCPSFYT